MKILKAATVFALLAMTTMVGATSARADGHCDSGEIMGFDPDEPITGSATFCVTSKALKAKMRARNLVPGEAYTVWWAYFDDPFDCAEPGVCGPVDFGGDNPQAVFGRMDSVVAGPGGRRHFAGRFRGMKPSSGSQVWLLIVGHGAADYDDGRHLARQLLTPEDPDAGTPHLGNKVDGLLGTGAAVAVFVVD